jgi:arginyl-tRNA synthetase
LGNILEATGYRVEREYYYNDAGKQMENLGSSLRARYLQLLKEKVSLPRDGYQGGYLKDIARKLLDKNGPECKSKDLRFFTNFAEREILKGIKKDLKDSGVRYDNWIKETTLHKEGKVKKAVNLLKKRGCIYEREGALWLRSTSFGDDKDRVVIKSNGEPTYLAPDIAYHEDKYERGFKWLINIFGPDHHGYVPRLRAAIEALGHPKTILSVLILQLVTLYRGKEKIPMSTRSGDFVTLGQVLEEVGRDVTRFFFLMRGVGSHLDFDLELAKKESLENPVYYLQYAHARISSILKEAKKEGVKEGKSPDLTLLKEEEELELAKKLANFPQEILLCVKNLEPQGMVRYLQELATLFHQYYTKFRVISSQGTLTSARLFLVKAVRTVLKNGLTILGISAPEKM